VTDASAARRRVVLDPHEARLDGGDVLVLRALGLGDALTGIAPLRGVRRAWPGRRIVLAAPPAVGEWLAGLGVVDAVLSTEGLRPAWCQPRSPLGGGHLAVNLHGRGPESHRLVLATGAARLVAFDSPAAGHSGPPWHPDEHEVDRWCRLVRAAGGDCSREDLRLPAPAPEVSEADHAPSARDAGPPVVLHPGAAAEARRWPLARWTALARVLVEEGNRVVVTGSAAEERLCNAIVDAVARPEVLSMAGLLDLSALSRVVAGARLVVCGDTGVAHLATAYGTPSVLLFGPTAPDRWGPAIDTDRHTVIWHGDGNGDPHAGVLDPALAAITVGEVATASARLLAAHGTA